MPAIWFAVGLSLMILTTATSAQDIRHEVEEGGSLLVAQMDTITGNDVFLRSDYLPSGANRSWIDHGHSLNAGRLTKYFFYIHNLTSGISSHVMPQIWRPAATDSTYRLVWQQNISIELNHTRGALCTVYTDRFNITTGDRIGIATLSNPLPISFDVVEGQKTYSSSYMDNSSFVVGDTYEFDGVHSSGKFSIAVEIVPLETTTTPKVSGDVPGTVSDRVETTTEAQSSNLTTISTAVPATNSDRGLIIGISVLAAIVMITLLVGVIYVSKRRNERQPVEVDGLAMTQDVPNGAVNVIAVSDPALYESMHDTTYSEIMQTNEVTNVPSNATSGNNADPNSVYNVDGLAMTQDVPNGDNADYDVIPISQLHIEQVRSETIPKTPPGEKNIANNDPDYKQIDLVNADQYHDAQATLKILPETNIANNDPVCNKIYLVNADQYHDAQTIPKTLPETNIANNDPVYDNIDLVNADQYYDARTQPKVL